MAAKRVASRHAARWLIVISGLFGLSVSLSNTFLNVYLWKVDKSFTSIGLYNLSEYLFTPMMFILAGALAKHRNSVLTLRLGLLFHAGFYALTLFGGQSVAHIPALLGSVLGTAAGFYWCSFNELSMRYTDSLSRDRFYGMNGVVGSVAGMVAPPVAGFLITLEDRFGGLTGYHMIFGLSLALFMLAGLTSFQLHEKLGDSQLHWRVAVDGWKNWSWRRVLWGCFVYGWREGLFMFLIGLLMYIATDSELELGEFLLLQSALSFISFFIVGRLVHPQNRIKFLGIGAVSMALCAMLFLLPLRAIHIVWYGAAIATCLPLFIVPFQGVIFDTIGDMDRTHQDDNRMEHIITREIFSNAGRVLALLLFLFWVRLDPIGQTIPKLAVGIGLVQIGTWWLIRRVSPSEFRPRRQLGHTRSGAK